MRTDDDMHKVAIEGSRWLRMVNARAVRDALPYIPSSDYAGAWLIGAWSEYHTGRPPRAIHKSRGHSFKVDIPGLGELCLHIVDPYDHREGVEAYT